MRVDLSRQDKREYRLHVLENGLRLLLISEPFESTEKEGSSNTVPKADPQSAAAVCVNVGSFHDPSDAPGLSNLLARMLLVCIEEADPKQNLGNFLKYCDGNAGSYVTYERSCLYLEIQPVNLKTALELLARAMSNPNLEDKTIQSQIEKLDDEYKRCKLHEYTMLQQFVCQLSTETSPFNKFHKGSSDSLINSPKRTVEKLREMLLAHLKSYYSAHLISIAVQSRNSLAELEAMTLELFSKFAHRKCPIEKPRYMVDPFQNPRFPQYYEVMTNRGKESLRLIWSLQPLRAEYESNPVLILSELIKNMNEGGLGHYLEENHLATELECDFGILSEFTNSSNCTLLVVRMNLTETGTRRIPEICGSVYDYLRFLKQLASQSVQEKQENIWDFLMKDTAHTFSTYVRELQVTQESRFIDRPVLPAVVTTVWLVNMMSRVSMEHVYSGYSLIKKPNMKLLHDILTELSKRKACIIHSHPNFKAVGTNGCSCQVEPWLGLQYRTNSELYEKINWRCFQCESSTAFSLPARNRCIIETFNKLPCSNELKSPEDLNASVERMAYRDYGAMWFQRVIRFQRPTATFSARFASGAPIESIKSSCLLLLYVEDMQRNLERISDKLRKDGMCYTVEALDYVIELRVSGPSELIRNYYNTILLNAFKWSTNMEPGEFEELRCKIRARLQSLMQDHDTYSQNIFQCLVQRPAFSLTEQLDALGKIALSDLMAFSTQLLAQVCVEAYGAGDIAIEEIQGMFDRTIRSLRCIPVISSKKTRITNIPPGTYCIDRDYGNSNNKLVHYERYNLALDAATRTEALNRLLVAFINSELATFLKISENVGMKVRVRHMRCRISTGDRSVISLCIQEDSGSKLSSILEHLVSAFWYCVMPYSLASMNEDLLRKYKEEMITSLVKLRENPDDYIEANWEAIRYDRANFNKSTEMVDCLKGITNYELARFFCEHYLSPDNRKSIIVRITSTNKASTWTRNPGGILSKTSGSGCSKAERKLIDSYIHEHFQLNRIDVMALRKYPEMYSMSTSGFPEHIKYISDLNYFK